MSVVSNILGGYFIALGVRKTIPITAAITTDYNIKFDDFASVNPLAPLGLVPNNVVYKYLFGSGEIVFGSMVIFGNLRAKRVGCLGLTGLMVLSSQASACLGAFGLHFWLPIIVSGGLVWYYYQFQERKPRNEDFNAALWVPILVGGGLVLSYMLTEKEKGKKDKKRW